MKRFIVLTLALLAAPAIAAEHELPYHFQADVGNMPSVQRGARDFMSYCSGCHSLKYLRYNRMASDLGIPEDLLKKHLMLTSEKPGEPIKSAMPADAEKWFGSLPPDLSLSTRQRGEDWVYNYLLTFYLDPSKPTGVNNLALPGASMPHVLGELQGWQVMPTAEAAEGKAEGEHHGSKLELVQPGSLKPEEYKALAADLTNFLAYAAEPGRAARVSLGWKVLLYLVLFTALCYLLKREFWKDVH